MKGRSFHGAITVPNSLKKQNNYSFGIAGRKTLFRPRGQRIHYSRIFGRKWSAVENWARSELNPWLKLSFEILRQAGASL